MGHANVGDMMEARDCKTSADRTVVGHMHDKDKAIVNVMREESGRETSGEITNCHGPS